MNDPTAETVPPVISRWLIANLLAAVGFGLVSMTICLPSMPEWGALFDVSQGEVQLTFSSFVLGLGAAQLFYGPLSDRFGRRRLLLFGFVVAGLGSLAAALASSLYLLVLARALQGAGAAAGMVIGRAMVQDFFEGSERPRVMAYIGMVMGMCPPLATIVGGQVHVVFGWRANFLVTAGLAFGLVVMTWRVLPADGRQPGTRAHWLREMFDAYAALARVPAFLAYAAILGMCTGTFYVFLAGAPTVLGSYGVGPASIGFYIMFIPLSYIAGNFLTSRLIKYRGEMQLMMFGQICALAGIALVLLLAWLDVRSAFAVALPLMLLGIGHGLLMPSTLAGTVSLVPALAGTAAGAAGLFQHFFGALGGYSVGLVSHDNAANLALLMLAFMLFALFSQLSLMRRGAGASAPRRS